MFPPVLRLLIAVIAKQALDMLERKLHQFNEDPSKPVRVYTRPLRQIALVLLRVTRFLLPISIEIGLANTSFAGYFDRGDTILDQDITQVGKCPDSGIVE